MGRQVNANTRFEALFAERTEQNDDDDDGE